MALTSMITLTLLTPQGIMEFVESALLNPNEDSAKVFGDDGEFVKVTKVIEGCQAANVAF